MNSSTTKLLRLLVLGTCLAAVPVLVSAAETATTTAAAKPMATQQVGGKIVSFDAKTGVLVLKHAEKEISVTVPETIAITKDGATASRAVLVAGAHATAVVHQSGTTLIAESIAVRTKKKTEAK